MTVVTEEQAMADGECEVCGGPDPIGVASLIVPMSIAFCQQCAQQSAQPEWVFQYLYDYVMENDDPTTIVDGLVTYKDGRYITWSEWAKTAKHGPTMFTTGVAAP